MTYAEINAQMLAVLREHESTLPLFERYGIDYDETMEEAMRLVEQTLFRTLNDGPDSLEGHLASLWVGGVLTGAALCSDTSAND